jgi:outer membrane protein OmpA-like peptidoglycan-associated protein
MSNRISRSKILAASALVAGATAFSSPILSQSQPTESQIRDALRPDAARSSKRSIGPREDAAIGNQSQFINSLRARSARSLTLEERETASKIARARPSIDLEINFDFDSAMLTPQAVSVLVKLGRALSAAEFKNTVFLVNGHTDAKGTPEYNQDLSERRAEAVKRLLVKQFDLSPTTLIAIGYGKTQLKNEADPFAAENRRVQVVNTEVK